jgi:hypothetical protein
LSHHSTVLFSLFWIVTTGFFNFSFFACGSRLFFQLVLAQLYFHFQYLLCYNVTCAVSVSVWYNNPPEYVTSISPSWNTAMLENL